MLRGCGLLTMGFIIAKNVAIEIAEKICSSVTGKLDGKTIGTFSGK